MLQRSCYFRLRSIYKSNLDYGELKVRDLDNVEEYGAEDEEITEDSPAEDDEPEETEEKAASSKPVTERSILEEKLAKAKKALKAGFMQRNEAVKRNAERR